MADGKWIPGLIVDTPVVEAAQRVLSLRLDVIGRSLPLAAEEYHKDIEHVHQLRVGTRRARAALEIFADCLPGKVWDRARRKLRRIRRAAADARDWDVFQDMLRSCSTKRPASELAGLDFLRGLAFERRLIAQQLLIEAAKTDLDTERIVSSVEAPEESRGPERLGDMALPVLGTAIANLETAVANNATGFEYLHRIRILGKKLRYAMEVFADCFAPPFRQVLYPAIEEMQEILGAANDSHVAIQRIEEVRDQIKRILRRDWPRFKPGLESLLRFHRRRLPDARKRLTAWRNRWKKSVFQLPDLLLPPACPHAFDRSSHVNN